jgi:hypothetical protein
MLRGGGFEIKGKLFGGGGGNKLRDNGGGGGKTFDKGGGGGKLFSKGGGGGSKLLLGKFELLKFNVSRLGGGAKLLLFGWDGEDNGKLLKL